MFGLFLNFLVSVECFFVAKNKNKINATFLFFFSARLDMMEAAVINRSRSDVVNEPRSRARRRRQPLTDDSTEPSETPMLIVEIDA